MRLCALSSPRMNPPTPSSRVTGAFPGIHRLMRAPGRQGPVQPAGGRMGWCRQRLERLERLGDEKEVYTRTKDTSYDPERALAATRGFFRADDFKGLRFVGSRPVEPSPAAGDEGLESVEMVGPRRGVTKSQDVVERELTARPLVQELLPTLRALNEAPARRDAIDAILARRLALWGVVGEAVWAAMRRGRWQKALEGFRQTCREAFDRAGTHGARADANVGATWAPRASKADWKLCGVALLVVHELHLYAVFLDVKGDRVLLEQLWRRFGELLQLPVASMPQVLARTRRNTAGGATGGRDPLIQALGPGSSPGTAERELARVFRATPADRSGGTSHGLKKPVESVRTLPACADCADQALARRKQLRMLQRLHEKALQQWNREWQATIQYYSFASLAHDCLQRVTCATRFLLRQEASRPEPAGKLGVKFWDSSFCHLFKIAWPDFVEAFENFYLQGRCPNDLVRQLRLRVRQLGGTEQSGVGQREGMVGVGGEQWGALGAVWSTGLGVERMGVFSDLANSVGFERAGHGHATNHQDLSVPGTHPAARSKRLSVSRPLHRAEVDPTCSQQAPWFAIGGSDVRPSKFAPQSEVGAFASKGLRKGMSCKIYFTIYKHFMKLPAGDPTHSDAIWFGETVNTGDPVVVLGVTGSLVERVTWALACQVTRNSWQLLLEGHSRTALDSARLNQRKLCIFAQKHVLNNLPGCIYREPLEEDEVIEAARHPCGSFCGHGRSSLPAVQVDVSEWGFPSPQPTPQVAGVAWGGGGKGMRFAHSAADDDMSIPTQTDVRHPTGAPHGARDGSRMSWDDFVTDLCASHKPWWIDLEDEVSPEMSAQRESALRAVDSCISCTRRSLVFRVVSGDLGQNRPVLQMPCAHDEKPQAFEPGSPREAAVDFSALPALVVAANGSRFSGVTKFGRNSSKRTLVPDCPMSEPIASRSHFNVIHDQDTDQFYIMDAGSKWGTFVKIGSNVTLSCGDWIRVGGVEFIVRFCGGGCKCQKSHIHYRLHAMKMQEVWTTCGDVLRGFRFRFSRRCHVTPRGGSPGRWAPGDRHWGCGHVMGRTM
ncbi:unnamed protein product [Durusdinium trenchii]|uniref:FHA domain-containing protein n=1 Tax=Durusdinium trenchii TaxID=1381693 RepID=A0ABP0RDJ7_9DINO